MEPARKPDYDIEPDTRPDLRVIDGGGETTPDRPARGNLRAVSDAEQQGDFNPGAGSEPSVREQEQEGDNINASPIRSTFSGSKGGKQKLTRAQITRRVGLIGGGGGIIGIALFFISGFLPLGGILLNLGETATANRDTQNTILSKRLNKVIDSKIGGDMTTGSCNIVKIACRFSRPSNALLSRLSDNGIDAVGKDGNPIKKTLLGFPNEKPTTYRFNGQDIKATDFVKTLGSNSEFRKAFTTAYNMRYWGYADSVIKKLFYSKEGIDRSGKTTNEVDSKDPQKSIQSIADGAESDNAVKNAASEDAAKSAVTSEIEDIATKEAQSAAKRIAKSGDPALMAAGAACVAVNVPGMFANAVRLYQMRQEIVLASTLVLTAASMLKAGDMSPETMATIGTLLTATAITANGTKTKSAMDASGLKSVIFGDNTSAASDASLAKFIPGKSAIDATKGISAFANSDAVKTGCAAINSPEAQVIAGSIEGAIGATGVGGAIVGILKAGTWAAIKLGGFQAMIDLATPLIKQGIGALIAAIPAATIMNIFGNQDIAKAQNEDLGNVLGGGLS
ncbi:MAG TPA: hypothetical protein VN081_01770, partial [Dongiaceae bacterium]|nr:hypothetical protein [Dongiaceae bacterium]